MTSREEAVAVRVLVVDDEADYCEQLLRLLEREGYEVCSTESGREAIDLGAGFRPDVLIADWLLHDHIHGLHVSQALAAVRPDMETILITGFASSDLKSEAKDLGVVEFIEKPFDADQIVSAVRRAVRRPSREEGSELAVGVVEVITDGNIIYANPRARQMFSRTDAGAEAESLQALLGGPRVLDLDLAAVEWIEVAVAAPEEMVWKMHARELRPGNAGDPGRDGVQQASSGRWLVLLLPGDQKTEFQPHSVVRMLMGGAAASVHRWPFPGQVLAVEPDELSRRLHVNQFDRLGCICHAAESPHAALRLLESDPDIQVVLLDHGAEGSGIADLVEQLRRRRPQVTLVGNSSRDRRREFAAMGVNRYLPRPWRIEDLIALLVDPVGDCAECGLSLPLRLALPGEVAETWECLGCRSRYSGIRDDEAPEDIRDHVRSVGVDEASPGDSRGQTTA